jgi:N-formylglutamate deformylase
MSNPAYQLLQPEQRLSSVVFASPHSGSAYTAAFMAQTVLDHQTIRSSEDAFVDQLFDSAPSAGAPLLMAQAPRAYLDLNRSSDELDPALIEGARRFGNNPRVASGLGVIPRVVANGRAIYDGKLPMSEAQRRIESYWRPYHMALQQLLNQAHAQFGQAILIDCHSMPREAIDGTCRTTRRRPEIVLGDRFGAAASNEIVEQVEAVFAGAGLVVTRNMPFAGAYATQAYGRPSRSQHAVQIEIDRSIYMDEAQVRPNENFETFRTLMRAVTAEIAQIGYEGLKLAAE